MNGKLVNKNMLLRMMDDKPKDKLNANNKNWVDEWISIYYNTLFDKFARYGDKITSRDYSKVDVLHETIIRIYETPTNYKDKESCWKAINKKFKIKQ